MGTGERQLPGIVKAVFWFVVVNAMGGALVLLLFPAKTESYFFWNMTPPINAMLMGGMYLVAGSAVLYAILRGTWEAMRFMAVMASAFTTLLFIVTIVHMDRFIPGIRLYYWLLVYFVAATFAVSIYWYFERSGSNRQAARQEIRPLTRLSALATGTAILVLVIVGLFAPEVITRIWPWTISPLMMRVFMSWLSALAAGTLWFGFESDWTRVQPVAYMLIAVPVLIAILLPINRADLTGNPLTLTVFIVLLVLMGLTGLLMVWQQRSSRAASLANEKLPIR
ncbi:MAG TPA: hypothetical protein VK900_10270 [Anaerolineales bacterium]|nr:hypothetical protein [Anaerolineales bacterium]